MLRQDAVRALAAERRAYDLILADPPYDFAGYDRLAPHLARLVAEDGLVVVQTPAARGTGARRPERPHLPPLRLGAPYAVRAMITAICPGSYDPVTNGHVDVIARASEIFDRVVVGVVGTPQHKETLLTIEERVDLVREAVARIPNVEVDVFKELVVDFARRWDAKVIVKGLRVISDFEWEFQMNQLNRTLAPEIETVYVMASPQVSFVARAA